MISKSSTSYQDRQYAPTSSQPFSLAPLFLSSTYSFSRLRNFNLGQNRWEICNPPPPQIKDGKMARFGFCAASSLLWGDGGLLFHFILSKIAILDKKNRWEICNPLPPKSRMGKWRVLAFARLHPCFGGGGRGMGVCCSILFCPRLLVPTASR